MTSLPSATEIVVVGAGAIGASAAYALARDGHEVVVLDRGEGGEENIRNAGIPYSPLFRITDLELD